MDTNGKIKNPKNFVDLVEDKNKKDDENNSNADSDNSIRNKDKELEKYLKFLKSKLSFSTLRAIKNNPEKMEEIIEGLKKRGELKEEYDVMLEKFTSRIKRRKSHLLTK